MTRSGGGVSSFGFVSRGAASQARWLVNDGDITLILQRIEQGDPHAAEQLLPLVYDELRRLAAARMARERPGQTLQPTALVHEAWLRLGGDAQPAWANRAHFFAAAAEGMRRILVDAARRKQAARHGGGLAKLSASETGFDVAALAEDDEELLRLNEALDALAAHDPRKAELVKQRYFAGLTLEEAGEVLGISPRTAKRDWAYARAWLFNEMQRLRA
ncbi:RNA polymerase subunit sigma [Opitutus sp. ER46]|nr:RNA polymerase subunit sigma [Opitutus sp. ER46]